MLVECQGLNVERERELVLEGLELVSEGSSLALVGDAECLFDVMSGRAQRVAGRFDVAGVDARQAVVSGRVGVVVPGRERSPRWTVLELLEKSALLAGVDSPRLSQCAKSALERVGLSGLGPRRLSMLSPVELIAIELAAALQTDPELLALHAPFRGLDAVPSDWLWQVIQRGVKGCQLLVSFDAALLDHRERLEHFEQLALIHQRRVVAVGSPKQLLGGHCTLLSVTRLARTLAEALQDLGFQVHATELSDDTPLSLIVNGEQEALSRAVARLVAEQQIPVIELVPLSTGPRRSALGGGGGERAM